jgi:V/A-type H+/Na+-transporting ATPase subunit E
MEEISPGSAVEREIREDARKKAERLLKQAEADVEAMEAEYRGKAALEAESLAKKAQENSLAYRKEILSRLPLEKKRARLTWTDARLREALGQAVAALDAVAVSGLLLPKAERACLAFEGRTTLVSFAGIPGAGDRLAAVLESVGAKAVLSPAGTEAPFIRLEAQDGSVSFAADLATASEELMDAYRGELCEALVGKEGLA